MHKLALRIEKVTNTFEDPAQVYAFGVRNVLDAATQDVRRRQLLNRSEVIADAMFRCMGPFAIRDLKNATLAGRFSATDADLTWMMACYAIVGVSLAVSRDQQPLAIIDETVVRLLCMAGLSPQDAAELAARPRRALPKDQ